MSSATTMSAVAVESGARIRAVGKSRAAGRGLFRHSAWDAVFVVLALGHAALVVVAPVMPVIAIGVWWNSNTISHNFIHRPFFRSRWLNRAFACYLSLLLGIPQQIWKQRHLAHHAGMKWRLRIDVQTAVECGLVAALWATLLAVVPTFFLWTYLPGWLIGLAICAAHGYFEHVSGGTISHYGWLYNVLFFNDGFHIEHHAAPGRHWRRLSERRSAAAAATSSWPAVFRWLDCLSLDSLERFVLRSPRLQRFVVRAHERAFRRLLDGDAASLIRDIAVIGGGLFPRTVIVLKRLLPDARITVIDASRSNIDTARALAGPGVEFRNEFFDSSRHMGFDLAVFPLAFIGDRDAIYSAPPARFVLVHDWLWRRRGRGSIVSVALFKRLNLVVAETESFACGSDISPAASPPSPSLASTPCLIR